MTRLFPTLFATTLLGCTSPAPDAKDPATTSAPSDDPIDPAPTEPTVPSDTDPDGGTSGVDPTSVCGGLWEYDAGDDGTVDASAVGTFDLAFPGNAVEIAWDWDNDGVVDTIYVFRYDASGRKVREEHQNGQGQADTVWVWDRDVDGNVVEERLDADGDTPADGVFEERWTWAYDADGRVVEHRHDDGDADLAWNTIETTTWDPGTGLPVSGTEDRGGDGTVDVVNVYTHDALGRPVTFGGDTDGDGVLDFDLRRFEYTDPVERIGIESRDGDADGTSDFREDFAWDPVLELQTYWGSYNQSSDLQYEQFVVWDPATRLPAELDYYVHVGGTSHTVAWWTYDEHGRTLAYRSEVETPTNTDVVVERWTFDPCP